MSIKNTLICLALASSAIAASAATNLVVNGSFEQVSATNFQNSGTWGTYPSITGWIGGPNIEVRDNVAGAAQDGSNFVELDTNANSSMFQVVNASGWYNFSFWYSARPGVAAGSNTLGFVFGSLSGQVLGNTAGAPSGNVWQHYSTTVQVFGPTPLIFYAAGRSDSVGGSLDNVSVSVATSVPEPESYAMMLAGLGLMGAIARRRKSKSA